MTSLVDTLHVVHLVAMIGWLPLLKLSEGNRAIQQVLHQQARGLLFVELGRCSLLLAPTTPLSIGTLAHLLYTMVLFPMLRQDCKNLRHSWWHGPIVPAVECRVAVATSSKTHSANGKTRQTIGQHEGCKERTWWGCFQTTFSQTRSQHWPVMGTTFYFIAGCIDKSRMQVAICWACVLKYLPCTAQWWASKSTCAGATAGILIPKTALRQVPTRTAAPFDTPIVQSSSGSAKTMGESVAGPLKVQPARWTHRRKQACLLRTIVSLARLCQFRLLNQPLFDCNSKFQSGSGFHFVCQGGVRTGCPAKGRARRRDGLHSKKGKTGFEILVAFYRTTVRLQRCPLQACLLYDSVMLSFVSGAFVFFLIGSVLYRCRQSHPPLAPWNRWKRRCKYSLFVFVFLFEFAACIQVYAQSLQLHSCQQEGLSRFRDDKGKPDQEKVASSGKDVKRKKCQGESIPRDDADAVSGCDIQVARLRS